MQRENGMKNKLEMQRTFLWAAATAAPIAATALLVLTGVNEAAAGLVFLTLVVWFAARGGIAQSLYIAVLSAILFDYYFIPPIHTLRLAGPGQWVEMLSFLVSCVVVGRLAELARRQTRQAEQRREDVERLNELSQEMMLHEDTAALIRDIPGLIHRIFALESVMLFVADQDQVYTSGVDLPMSAEASLRAASEAPNPSFAATEGFAAMPLTLGLRPIGALGWQPTASLSREVASAAGAQLAIALTRAIAIEASARLEAAREGERLRTALIDSLTHELRTPLTAIRAAATTLMQDEGLDAAGRKDLATLVDEEASRLDALIGEAVEMAEIDAQVVELHLEQQPARALLEQAVEESQEALANHRVEIAIDGPDSPAWFDAGLLRRVLRHLLENAARYTPAGTRITLRSRRTPDRLEFSVEDNGPGIDSLDMPLIFEKFYRGKKGAAMGKGTGMGLAIARAILAAHGGAIEAKSTPGQGTKFHFWVPLVEREPAGDIASLK